MNNINLSTIIGISLSLVLIITSIQIGGSMSSYVDLPSFLIVVGSTFFVSAACFSFSEIFSSLKSISYLVTFSPASPQLIAIAGIQTAEFSFKNGLLELDKKNNLPLQNTLFNKWLSLIIDSEKLPTVEKLIDQEIFSIQDQQVVSIMLLRKAAEVAPALGLIGTLIGLVQMLSNLNDIAQIGPGMAVALLTTFYGAILSYVIFFPLASKLENNLKEEMLNLRLYKRVILSIAQRQNPRHLEYTLNSILPPSKKIIYYKY